MKKLLAFLFLLSTYTLHAQDAIKGFVTDEQLKPLPYATVALLQPADSTLAYYSITADDGSFHIRNVSAGSYILQSAFIGYKTFYKNIQVPMAGGDDIGTLMMQARSVDIGQVDIKSERIPMLLKKDTIEYDAGAFKTKPDAAAEDLLKKLPGVEVDRAGNIKAQGEDVKNVLVDGKEFFSSDPTVATKNLPADAVKKVQVYDKKSDEAELTGIDDGSRNKTINLLLKDDKKSAWMGSAEAGAGTSAHYMSSAKAYRFTKKSQFAALGMLNDINQSGFSFRDYMDFNGGLQSMGNGGVRLSLNDDHGLPVNFGQPVAGLITSGAGGLNYTYEKTQGNRINISYLGNGSHKNLTERTFTRNFAGEKIFTQNENLYKTSDNSAHRFNFNWRNKIDSTQNIIASGNAGFTKGRSKSIRTSQGFSGGTMLNKYDGASRSSSNSFSATTQASYLKKGNSIKLFKLAAEASGKKRTSDDAWNNITGYFAPPQQLVDSRTLHSSNPSFNGALSSSLTFKTGRQLYIVPEIKGGISSEELNNEQHLTETNDLIIDSLSPEFEAGYQWIRPAVSLRRSNNRSQFNFTMRAETGLTTNSLNDGESVRQHTFHLTPQLSWNYEYRSSRHINFYFESSVQAPSAVQLLPVMYNSNPLATTSGNRYLKPEYSHQAMAGWVMFDQFSFTSVIANIRGTYTREKINWSRAIHDDLSQQLTLTNVPYDYTASASVEFSTPIRKLGLNFHAEPSETLNQGISRINDQDNTHTNYTHALTLSIDNRKKEKWDASLGGTVQYTAAKYSLQHNLNTDYLSLTGFAEISYTPNNHFNFTASADVTRYQSSSFTQNLNVPLLKSKISYYLKGGRASVSLELFDIMNKNSGIERISELNYLQEKQSNIIGRYALVSFKYKLNKFDNSGSGFDIKVNGR